ncbi:MAG: Long-chain-fatty-acid--CoA ligase FadD15 [Alphaproteobacteria bacterium MarineAlpha9_Bin7]|nr:MAG: Long-chain-fatty-acid--CoA ligase FadD15 [Alphaproteobacteria bacterium MarineAlpha9_Bin7]
MKLDHWPNLVAMFFDKAQSKESAPFLWAKRDNAWQSISWHEASEQVSSLARALRAYGLTDGDRVVLVADNSPEWAIADFAIMAAGGVTVPAYVTNTPNDHKHILTDSGAVIAIVSTAKLATTLMHAATEAPLLKRVISIEALYENASSHITTTLWRDALDHGNSQPNNSISEAASIQPDSLACLIYTSGTGGTPKGVMLSHRSILCNCVGAYNLLLALGLEDEVFLSFLPLSHSYEHSCGLMFPISIGAQIYYSEGLDKLSSNLTEVRPTLMTSVPRLYEVMRLKILDGVQRAGGLREKLFKLAIYLGRKSYSLGGTLPVHERLLDKLVDKLVRDKVRGRFGGRLKAMVSGGAPLNFDVGIFFSALGLRLLQGYGQTEAAPVISCNPSSKIKLDTVGLPLAHVEVQLADDGEILVRGPLLMTGYWGQPKITNETLRGGWLHTGDIGEIDADGYLTITDRKKDIIVLSGGDNISPQRVEGILCLEPEIEQAIVIGDKRKHLVGILVPSEDFLKEWLKTNDGVAELKQTQNDLRRRDAISDAVHRANKSLSVIEQIRRFALAEQPFTVDNEMLTPTMKNRRHKIIEHYGETIETLY